MNYFLNIYLIKLALSSLLILTVRGDSCTKLIDPFLNKEHTCVYSKNDSNCSNDEIVDLKLVDEDNGKAELSFLVPNSICDLEYYYVKLHVDENLTDTRQCEKSTSANFWLHTELRVDIVNNNSSKNCETEGKIYFDYVFTGCYNVMIKPYKKYGSEMQVEKKVFLKSNFVKTSPGADIATYNTGFRARDSIQKTTLQYKCLKKKPVFKLFIYCNLEDRNMYTLYPNNSVNDELAICEESKKCDINVTKCEIHEMNENCDITIFSEIPKQNYTYIYKLLLKNEQVLCGMDWPRCEWTIHTTVSWPDVTQASSVQRENDQENNYLFVVVGVCAMTCAAVVLYLIRSRLVMKNPTATSDVNHCEQGLLETPRVVLVYARDCVIFMEAVQKLKELLITCGHCEVYDVHDPELFDEIAVDPHAWIRDKLRSKKYKTIMILTECGLLQTNSSANTVSVYREPACYDDLYLYAIKILSQNLDCESYTKLFKVIFNSDCTDYSSFKYINPYASFVLPDNVDDLLSEISDIKGSHDHNCDIATAFNEKCKSFESYCENNPNYLIDILNVDVQINKVL